MRLTARYQVPEISPLIEPPFPVVEPLTFRFISQIFNHYATPSPTKTRQWRNRLSVSLRWALDCKQIWIWLSQPFRAGEHPFICVRFTLMTRTLNSAYYVTMWCGYSWKYPADQCKLLPCRPCWTESHTLNMNCSQIDKSETAYWWFLNLF